MKKNEERIKVKKEFAVYKGEELISIGTSEECAKELNVTARYIEWMTTPTGKKRLANRKNPESCTSCVRLLPEEDE